MSTGGHSSASGSTASHIATARATTQDRPGSTRMAGVNGACKQTAAAACTTDTTLQTKASRRSLKRNSRTSVATVRVASGGSNPTPTLKCLVEDHQRRIVDKAPIDTATCKKLVLVVGTSSMKYVGGVYGRCVNEKVTTIAGRPVWGKYQHDNNIPDNWAEATQPNCQGTTVDGQRSEIFWSESWGWGVSSEKGGYHHRFSECIGGKKKDGSACNTGEDANIMGQFLHVRPGYGAGPAPSLTCVEWL